MVSAAGCHRVVWSSTEVQYIERQDRYPIVAYSLAGVVIASARLFLSAFGQ